MLYCICVHICSISVHICHTHAHPTQHHKHTTLHTCVGAPCTHTTHKHSRLVFYSVYDIQKLVTRNLKNILCIGMCVYVYLYSCRSHLEDWTSVKPFISLQFLNLRQPVGLLGWGIGRSQGHYLHRTTQTQNKHRQISVPWVEFEPMIPLSRCETGVLLTHSQYFDVFNK
jgi:hypothetical protein